jgi:predicted dehydrogenase
MNIGVLGLGFMGSTHLKAWLAIPGVRLGAVMDQNPKRLSGDLSEVIGNLGSGGERMDFRGVRQYIRPEEIVRDPNLDILDICLPTNLHAPIAMEALRAGKHVLVEKPMALTGEETDRMIETSEKAGRILMTAQVLRFHPAYEGLFALMDSGKLGAVRYAVFRRRCAAPTWGPWEFDPAQSGGGVFDLLIHDVDACLHAFGPPDAIRAGGYEAMARGIDTILANFEYPGFGPVLITGGWHHIGGYPFSMEYTVVADGGTAEFSSLGRPATVYWADGAQEALEGTPVDWYRAEIEYFLRCCRGGHQPARCPAEESAAAVKLTRMMMESRARQGERIACGLKVAV